MDHPDCLYLVDHPRTWITQKKVADFAGKETAQGTTEERKSSNLPDPQLSTHASLGHQNHFPALVGSCCTRLGHYRRNQKLSTPEVSGLRKAGEEPIWQRWPSERWSLRTTSGPKTGSIWYPDLVSRRLGSRCDASGPCGRAHTCAETAHTHQRRLGGPGGVEGGLSGRREG